MSSGITVCLSCSISRTCSLNNSGWKLEVNFSLPFDFPMLRIARWFPFKCWWASSSSLSENHLQRFALWNLNLEFSGLHYCLFVKVLQWFITERRRRDLNPRAAINDLHPFQGCPFDLLGTSPNEVESSTLILLKPKENILQRRGWDSNPRALSDKRFSRPPRYDHFDTSPCATSRSAQDLY